MIEYTMDATPTMYAGQCYRSTQEARWAAYFDLCHWRHAYEPYSLRTWLPDFVLPDVQGLVEVKPLLLKADRDVWHKITAAARFCSRADFVLLTTSSPFDSEGLVSIGWIGYRRHDFRMRHAYLAPYRTPAIFGAEPEYIREFRFWQYETCNWHSQLLLERWTHACENVSQDFGRMRPFEAALAQGIEDCTRAAAQQGREARP